MGGNVPAVGIMFESSCEGVRKSLAKGGEAKMKS